MSTISASTTSTTAYKVTADTTGTLVLQTGSTPTTAVTIDASQNTISTTTYQVSTNTTPSTSSGNAIFYKSSSGAVFSGYQVVMETGSAGSRTTAATFDASGNLGVGTTSPNTRLHLQGASATDGSMKYLQDIFDTTAYNSSPQTGARVALKYDSAGNFAGMGGWSIAKENATDGNFASALLFHTRANGGNITERARIDSSGNLLVGTTTVLNSSVATFYKTATGTNQRVLTLVNNGTSGSTSPAGMIISYPNASSGNGSTFIQCTDSNTDRFYVLGSGNVQNANNSYGAISDAKLKENITDATPKLADLMQVRIRNYNLKTEPENKQIGVIAQELEQVFPAMVDETVDRDAEGNDLGTTTKSVKYSVFVPMLIKALQEQQAIIETLTNRITALEAK